MKIRLVGLVLPLALIGCRESYCERVCVKVRPQLIRDFGVLEANLDCSAQKFAERDTCVTCERLFEQDYAVTFAPSCAAGGPTFIEPH